MSVEPGQELLHYRLIEKIGEGGMGEVWKAEDTTLDREVAVKILPQDVASDEQRLARFEREAKLLASLNHPNVATVYGVHTVEGQPFLAMELVPGEDLSERLQRGRLPLDQTLSIVRSIAGALEAAHARGVIHRDLKPANVRLTPDGTVKILDFGLAKALAAAGEPDRDPALSPTVTSTSLAGVLLGTAAYMAPEQARGQEVDSRADIWAFGCVLWECLTGKLAFGGPTVSDTLAAILGRGPDWAQLPSDTPPNVARLLRRCLAKDSRERLHHIADARLELDADDEEAPGTPASTSYRTAFGIAAAAFVVVLALLLFTLFVPDPVPGPTVRNPLDGASFTRITDFEGSEYDAAISRDGRFVTFISGHGGFLDVYVSQIGTNDFVNLTRHDQQVNYVREVRRTGFNADGTEIWIGGGLGRRMRTIPLLGGKARPFLDEDAVNVDWSPDGTRMAFHHKTGGDHLFVADADGSNPREILALDEITHQHFPKWSVDGEWIYLSRGRPATGEMALWRVRPDGSDLERLTERPFLVMYPTPLDERTVLYIAREPDGAGPWIWAVDAETKVSRRISIGLERYNSLSISADKRRLVATREDPHAELWTVPILDRPATEADAKPFEQTDGLRALAPRFSGSTLYFLSSLGGGDGLSRLGDGEITEIWRGAETALLEPPAISPDGEWIVLLIRQEEGWYLRRVSADGSTRERLTDRIDARGAAAWSPDGRWVATGGSVDGVQGLFKVPADGGEPQLVVQGEALNPQWSPDGGMIVYSGNQEGAEAPLLAVDPEGNPIDLPDIRVWRGGERYRFTRDGSALIFMQGQPTRDFELLDLKTMQRRVLTRFTGIATMRTFDVTPDGKSILFDRLYENSDIVLIELEDGQGTD